MTSRRPKTPPAKALALLAVLTVLGLAAALRLGPGPGREAAVLRLATTTSVDDSGLLDVLLPPFERSRGCRVDVIAVGSGQALELGRNGDVDVLIVHSPRAEEDFVAAGYGLARVTFMSGDFVLVGPPDDPAGVRASPDLKTAFRRLAAAGVRGEAAFISRGDDSGTHRKELDLWRLSAVTPQGSWYLDAGAGMADTLRVAAERGAYTLSDRATFLTASGPGLTVLFEGDPLLDNPYSAIAVSPAAHPGVAAGLAQELVSYLVSPEAQALIADFGVDLFGQPVLRPVAEAGGPAVPSAGGPAAVGARRLDWLELGRTVTLSLAVSGTAVLLASLVALPLGAWLGLARFRGRPLVLRLLWTLMGLPPTVVGLFVYVLLSSRGPLGRLDLLFTPAAMVLAQWVLVTPIVAGYVAAAVEDRDRRFAETAAALGATPGQARLLILREARPAVLAALAGGLGRATSEVGAVFLVGGNIRGSTRVMTTAILLETRRGDFGQAFLLGAVLLALGFVLNSLIHHLQGSGR
ncbi:MAG: ABC transporter permease [Firmicutes bacterium]|nr:ABC transporter permease [Bacillota bacterium]